MYPQERQEAILQILEKHNYVTVAYLIETLCYSSATINRDLNALEKRGLVRRSYGGVESLAGRAVPVEFRLHKQHHAKEMIARRAAELVQDGDTIFIDGSTTAQFMGPHLVGKVGLMVITNNITLASYLSERGVCCIVLGGKILEAPSMTGDEDTLAMARSYRANKMFFSTGSVTDDGFVGGGGIYHELHRIMMSNAKESVFLIDNEKCEFASQKIQCDFSELDYVISNHDFSHLSDRFPDTNIITVKA